MTRILSLIAALAVLMPLGATLADAKSTYRPKYGCFKVTSDALNIRAKPYRSSSVIGTASGGYILIKRKRNCTLRGFWCAVKHGDLKGYADKKFMKFVPCPPAP